MTELNIHLLGLATKAAHLSPKPQRADLLHSLARIAESKHNANDLAALYRFFMPPLPVKARNDFAWVSRAVADKEDARKYLHYVHSMEGKLVASNGHIAFVVPTDLPEGAYHKSGLRETPINPQPIELPVDFPGFSFPLSTIERFAQEHKDLPETNCILRSLAVIPHHADNTICYVLPYENQTFLVNKRYMDLAVDGGDVFGFTVCISDSAARGRVEIRKGQRVAYVMPMRG